MTQELKKSISLLTEYLSVLPEEGFSESRADEILSLLKNGGGSPFGNILSSFGCGDFEAAVLALCMTVSLSGKAAKAASALTGNAAVTPALAAAMFFGTEDILPFEDALRPYSPLSRLLLGVSPVYNAPLRIRSFILDYAVSGDLYDDSFLPHEDDEPELVPIGAQENAMKEILSFLQKNDRTEPFILQLTGEGGTGRHTCARLALLGSGIPYVPLKLGDEMTAQEIEELSVKLILSGGIPVVSSDRYDEGFYTLVKRLSDEVGFVTVISERSAGELLSGAETVTVTLSMPTLREQYRLWQHESERYSLAPDVDLSELPGEFEMTAGAVSRAMRYASVLSDGDPLTSADIKNGCYRSFDADMGGKAVKLSCSFSWKDIVLPEQSRRLLMDACQHVRLRHKVLDGWGFTEKMPYGRGVSMIFTGPPGTGKTMGAQVIAAELGMDIYKISLANVVSKYIGETEKNLNDIFEKAKLCKGILFFDEADVLFSRRTEVKEANDKYSNMESAFLLQKTEEFSGVVILATNLVQNFDEAFKRRMRFIVDFPFPDAVMRREMWEKAFPKDTPMGDIDLDFLVERFELTGSNIRNIALHSAFLAAGENSPVIGMKHIMESLRNEYAKSGKAFTKAEAGEYYYELSGR